MESRSDIHELLMLKLTGGLSKDQQEEIDALIEGDPEVNEAWKHLQEYYLLHEKRRADFDSISATDIMAGVKDRVFSLQPRPAFSTGKWITAAAAALTGVGIFIYAFTKTNHSSKVLSAVHKNIPAKSVYLELQNGQIIDLSGGEQYQKTEDGQVTLNNNRNTLTFIADRKNSGLNKLIVPHGKEYSIRLSDGTEIRMNAGSTLQFPFGFAGSSREISLTGEAYVKVAAAAGQPFTVHTPEATIQVLGTEFNINTYSPGKAAISLVQGAVKVLAGKQKVVLQPGFQAEYTTQNGINTHPFDKNDVLSWLEGEYDFRETPLSEIIPILERWYDVKIITDHPAVADKTFTMLIKRPEGIKAFLEMLKVIRGADYYYKNDTIHIK
ncbi:FecR domain-containing protein [Chitinophaga sp. CF418]|uniref:FecR domain-containing protein n=1 Tax=Chitinophaga sp. CF418 TaxID=1855287 RepID=UPI000912E86D|nr:FecR domain-containing protein [Chitinophaga sp. CF418]SHL88592.1 FecR family protein [Chitinophaga sp. CF418]